jgi:hypothetical protein
MTESSREIQDLVCHMIGQIELSESMERLEFLGEIIKADYEHEYAQGKNLETLRKFWKRRKNELLPGIPSGETGRDEQASERVNEGRDVGREDSTGVTRQA